MATIKQVKERFERLTVSVMDVVSKKVEETQEVILDLNRDQILYGRNSEGRELTPDYLSDPYFKTQKQAKAYSDMKFSLEQKHRSLIYYFKIQLFTEKNRETPNLIINGNWFFNHFFINVTKDSYTIGSNGIAANDIESKYGNIVYGLASESKAFYWKHWLRPAILEHLGKREA